jgi:hypothetical protein
MVRFNKNEYYIFRWGQLDLILPKFLVSGLNIRWFFFKTTITFKCYLKNFFFSFLKFTTIKIKFRHKISWVFLLFRGCNWFVLDVNKSHYTYLKNQGCFVKRKKKYLTYNTLTLFSLNWVFIKKISAMVLTLGEWNKFTSRGFRLNRQSLQKKQGKVSSYTAFKSKIF